MDATPRPGSFGLSRIGGWVGALVAAGQAVNLDGSRYTHAFLVIDNGSVVQAMPGGAQIAPLRTYLGRDDVRFCDAPVQADLAAHRRMLAAGYDDPADIDALTACYERNLRAALAAEARQLANMPRRDWLGRQTSGVPYSFADYLALAAVRLNLPSTGLRRYVASSGHMICSQLVDYVYAQCGLHLFDDGRLPQDVTPGDLDAYRVAALESADSA